MAQRPKRLTKKEKKAQDGSVRAPTGGGQHQHRHIHCTACGKHLDEEQFEAGSTTDLGGATESGGPEALWLTCDHGSSFASCSGCAERTQALLAEHDRTNQPVRTADAWH